MLLEKEQQKQVAQLKIETDPDFPAQLQQEHEQAADDAAGDGKGNIVFLQIIGDMLISNSDDTVINIWDLKSGRLIKHFEPYLDKVK